MDEIFDSIIKHFPRLKREISKKLSFDIRMVALGVKPSLLVDTIAVNDIAQFEKFIVELNTRAPVSFHKASSLKILCVKDDFFIVNLPDLLQTIEKRRIYIDVSSKCQEPTLITESSEPFGLLRKEIIASLRKMLIENSEDIVLNLQLKDNWNITSVFGILIDYPVVYWYEIEDIKTCLEYQNLLNIKLKSRATIKTWTIEREVYSFTIPQCVMNEEVDSFVESWILTRHERANHNKVILSCDKNMVNLSTVLL